VTDLPAIPHALSALVDERRQPTPEWYRWLADFLGVTRKRTKLKLVCREYGVHTYAISNVTQANPGVVTISASHTIEANDFVFIDGLHDVTSPPSTNMNELTEKWFKIWQLSGSTGLTLFETSDTNGLIASTGATINTTAYTAYSGGGRVKPQLSRHVFDWDDIYGDGTGVKVYGDWIYPMVRGSGGRGGGSQWTQLGAGGGGGAKGWGEFPRPDVDSDGNTLTPIQVDRGQPGLPPNILGDLSLQSGITAVGVPYESGVSDGDLWAGLAGPGGNAANATTGADGGTQGVTGGQHLKGTEKGGMGDASAPVSATVTGTVTIYINHSFPKGGGPAGACNGQDGSDGSGGSPGNSATVLQPPDNPVGLSCTASSCPTGGGRYTGQSGKGGEGRAWVWCFIEDDD
jgi:hypothetical protein